MIIYYKCCPDASVRRDIYAALEKRICVIYRHTIGEVLGVVMCRLRLLRVAIDLYSLEVDIMQRSQPKRFVLYMF